MSKVQYPDHVMFCNSTGNQSINLIPAMQLGLKKAVLLSTSTATKWTERLKSIMEKYNLQTEVVTIDNKEEKSPNIFIHKVLNISKNYTSVLWNISGGQKIPTVALYSCFQARIANNHNDVLAYVEGNAPAIWYYEKDLNPHSIRSNVALTLDDLLHLSGSKSCADIELYPSPTPETASKLSVGAKALELYKSNDYFREAFFSLMSALDDYNLKDQIKASLNLIKPNISEIRVKKQGYQDLETSINETMRAIVNSNNLQEAKALIKKLLLIQKPQEIYNEYWNSIKRECIKMTIKRLYSYEQPLFKRDISKKDRQEFISAVVAIGGSVKNQSETLHKGDITFSSIGKNSDLFEWMVAAAVIEAVNKNHDIANSISQVHCNVKTQLIDGDCSKNDAEIDVLITTRFGTFIVLEAKTYDCLLYTSPSPRDS